MACRISYIAVPGFLIRSLWAHRWKEKLFFTIDRNLLLFLENILCFVVCPLQSVISSVFFCVVVFQKAFARGLQWYIMAKKKNPFKSYLSGFIFVLILTSIVWLILRNVVDADFFNYSVHFWYLIFSVAHEQSKDPNLCNKIIDMFAGMKNRRIDLIYQH